MTVLKLSHRYDGHTLRRTLLTRLMFMESQYAVPFTGEEPEIWRGGDSGSCTFLDQEM